MQKLCRSWHTVVKKTLELSPFQIRITDEKHQICNAPVTTNNNTITYYRVSHNWVFTLFWLFSQLPELLQRSILPFFNSPGDEDSKTHLTFLPTSKIDQVTEQNVRQIGFRYNLDKLCMYQKIISKSSLPHVLLCNLIKVRHREESKVSFGIVISWAVEKW